MPEAFDPYRQWLGIHKDEQPPHHYRLLGVRIFENELTVLENAADRAMLHLRSLSLSPHSPQAQQLLNEISAARICLLDPELKRKYDEQLEAKMRRSVLSAPAQVAMVPLPVVIPAPVPQAPIHNLPVASVFKDQPTYPTQASQRAAPPKTNRSAKNRSFGWIEIGKIVVGGFVGIVLAQVILFYGMDVDLFRVMGRGGKKTTAASSTGKAYKNSPIGIASERPSLSVADGDKSGGLQNPSGLIPVPRETHPPSPEITSMPPIPVPPAAPPSEAPVSSPPVETPGVSEETPHATAPSKSPVPSKEERVVLQKRMRETFPREFSKPPSRENKVALMEFLLQTAKSSTVNENDRFVLLSEALTSATTLKDFAKGAEIVDHLENLYEIDPITLRSYYLGKVAETASKQEDRKAVCICAIELADHALVLQRWENAQECIDLARKQLRYLVAKDLQESVNFRVGRITDLRGGWDAVVSARKVRETVPDDPSACLTEGRYRCFYEGDWQGGLPILAKSGDKQLSELASMDLETRGSERALEKGHAWYEAAKSNKQHGAGLARASFYYNVARDSAPAIDQERIRRRLDEIVALHLPRNLFKDESVPNRLRPLLETWESD